MRTTRHTFHNQQGHELSGRLDLPADGRPAAYALFSHCFTGSKNLNAVRHISRALIQEDIAVFRFDFTGLGESEGDFSDTNFSSNVEDLLAAAAFMEAQGMPPQLLIGHSLGGAAAIMAGPRIPSIKAVATIGTPSDPAHVQHHFEHHLEQIEEDGGARVSLGGRAFFIQQQFIIDLEEQDLEAILADMDVALLLMHSPQDTTVAIEHAAKLYQGARHPKSFVSLDGADHLLTRETDSLYAGNVIASWAARYISRTEDVLPDSEHRVAVQSEGELYADIKAGGFRLCTDASTRDGGYGLAPLPIDLVLSGIGGAVSIGLQQFAKAQHLPLSGVKVHVSQEEDNGRVNLLAEVWGSLSGEQVALLRKGLEALPALRWLALPLDWELHLAKVGTPSGSAH